MPILHLYSNMRNISRISISIIIFDQCLGKIDIKLMSVHVIIKENVGIGSLTFGQINWNIGNFNIYDTKCHRNIFIIFWLSIVVIIRITYTKYGVCHLHKFIDSIHIQNYFLLFLFCNSFWSINLIFCVVSGT